jgi:hypothetical protein
MCTILERISTKRKKISGRHCVEKVRMGPVKVWRKICEMSFFGAGVYLDCGWLKAEGKKVFPTLCFAERPVDPEEGLGGITKRYAPSQFFAFHEYVTGDVIAYFDERAVEDIEHGNCESMQAGEARPMSAASRGVVRRWSIRGARRPRARTMGITF